VSTVGDAKTGNRTESSTTATHQRINLLYELLQVLSAIHVCSHFSGHGYNHRMEETLENTLLGVAVLFWESCMEWFTGLESNESNLV